MEFEKIELLEPMIMVFSAMATTLLRLRAAARAADPNSRAAKTVVGAENVDVLEGHYGKRLGIDSQCRRFSWMWPALGVHQKRKCHGFPVGSPGARVVETPSDGRWLPCRSPIIRCIIL
jgi:hypothetical protein